MEKEKTEKSTMELINKYTRRRLTEDEVYIFNVTLCDNEIDRDFEAFDEKALEKLGKLFEGKTGISDHSMRSRDQTARIFSVFTEKVPGKKTSYGEPYVALKASAYMVRTEKNTDLIREIDAGIKKEISVGCAVEKKVCSVCGKEKCSHIRGESYSGKTCFTVLTEPTDAYEWSFVAVPAQREAGVTKSFSQALTPTEPESPGLMLEKALREAELSDKGKKRLMEYISALEKSAEDGKKYRAFLKRRISCLLMTVQPEMAYLPMNGSLEMLSTDDLAAVQEQLERRKSIMFPTAVQTAGKRTYTETGINEYKI